MSHEARYETLQQLGAGAQGAVSRALDRRLGREVVLKVFLDLGDPDARRRFLREGKLLCGVSHPAVMPILDLGTLPDGAPYYAMPYDPDALTLGQWLEDGTAGPAQWLAVIRDLAAGLDHIHERNLCHRDLKPSNVLVYPPSRAVLLDFGLAKLFDGSATRLTATGAVVGTMSYLAPEQARGEPAGPSTDLYQLGLILYEMIVGSRAIEDPIEYMRRVSEGRRPIDAPSDRVPDIDEELEEVLLTATALVPGDRPESGASLVAALERIPLPRWTPGGTARGRRRHIADPPTARIDRGDAEVARESGGTRDVVEERAEPLPSPPRRKAPSDRRRPVVAIVAALLLAAVVAYSRRAAPPRFEPPVTSLTLKGVRVGVRRDPPGPASLRVTQSGGSSTTLLDSSVGAEHVFDLVDLPDGGSIEIQPFWEDRSGPAVRWTHHRFAAANLVTRRMESVLEVTFETPLAVESRFAIGAPPAWDWSAWDEAPTTRHRFARSTAGRPVSTRWRIAHRLGRDTVEEDVILPPVERMKAQMELATWLERRVTEVTAPRAGAAASVVELLPAVEGGKLVESFPAWIFEELGGQNGLLSSPDVAPEIKDSLNRALGELEAWVAYFGWIGEIPPLPVPSVYGPHFGPSDQSRYPEAHQIPVVLRASSGDDKEMLALPTTLRGPGAAGRAGETGSAPLTATVRLGRLRPGSRVELLLAMKLPRGCWIEVTLNGKHLRLGSPSEAAAAFERHATAFDARYLVEGENRLSFAGATLPNMEASLLPRTLHVPRASVSLRVGH